MGDALAVCLLRMKGFTSSDFAKYHPGGALGKRLYLRVSDLIKNNEIPKVSVSARRSLNTRQFCLQNKLMRKLVFECNLSI